MAGETFEIAVSENEELWRLVGEFARSVPAESWVLVGGLMVQAHSLRSRIAVTRQTTDIDALLNLQATSVSEIAGPIQAMGFVPYAPTFGGAFHRFSRGSDTIDVMIGQDVRHSVRWFGQELLRSPGAAQAIARADTYVFVQGDSRFSIQVPDSIGAVIAKSAAHKVDRRDRERHLTDLIALLVSAPRGTFTTGEYSAKDRQYLRRVVAELSDKRHPRWLVLSDVDRARAEATFVDIAKVLI